MSTEQLVLGLRGAARILLAAGAREVVVSTSALRLTKAIEVERSTPRSSVRIGRLFSRCIPWERCAWARTRGRAWSRARGSTINSRVSSSSMALSFRPASVFPRQISIYGFARHLVRHFVEPSEVRALSVMAFTCVTRGRRHRAPRWRPSSFTSTSTRSTRCSTARCGSRTSSRAPRSSGCARSR